MGLLLLVYYSLRCNAAKVQVHHSPWPGSIPGKRTALTGSVLENSYSLEEATLGAGNGIITSHKENHDGAHWWRNGAHNRQD